MGFLNWVKKSRGERRLRIAAQSGPQAPCFEQLEPRVLLSADCLPGTFSMPLESPPIETPFEAAIVVDLYEGLGAESDGGSEGKKIRGEEGKTEAQMLRQGAENGLAWRLSVDAIRQPDGSLAIEQKYIDRLEMELGVIEEMGYPGYFLIVADFIRWSKENGIPVGPGRGSGDSGSSFCVDA